MKPRSDATRRDNDARDGADNTTTPQQDTKTRLFEAAITVFARNGFQGATVRAICERAGANVAAVNYHFGGKEPLYAQVLMQIFRAPRDARAHLRPDLTDAPPEERLREFIHNFFHEVYVCTGDRDRCGELGAIFLMEMANPTPALDEVVETYVRPDSERLVSIVAQCLGPGAAPEIVNYCAGAVVAQVLHFCNEGPIITRLVPDLPPVQDRLDSLAEMAFQFTLGGLHRAKALADGGAATKNTHRSA